MFEPIPSAPANVLAIRAVGQITDADYKTMLVPAVEKRTKAGEKLRLVYVIGPGFTGFDAHAAWDDAVLGLHHWRDFHCVALVTSHDWIAKAARLFLPLLPTKTKVFDIGALQDALAWAAENQPSNI